MNKACLDCSHSKHIEPGNYCYMFKDAPKNLPCGQHDKFAEQRKKTGELLLKNPLFFMMMVKEIKKEIFNE